MNDDGLPNALLSNVEPYFECVDSTDLTLAEIRSERVRDYLCHCISRNPADLRAHVRRIVMEHRVGDGEALYSALADLFLVLGQRGRGLRQRLLRGSEARLRPEHYRALSMSLETGLAEAHVLHAPGALLGSGHDGEFGFVRRIAQDAAPPLEEPRTLARQFLEYSQIEEAREILERANLEQWGDPALQQELLDLYRATRDAARLEGMARQLLDRGVALLPEWQELAAQLRYADG
jgi:hypothetical protein